MMHAKTDLPARHRVTRAFLLILALGTLGCQQALGNTALGPSVARAASLAVEPATGPIMVIGGGKDQDAIMRTFIGLSGGKDAALVVVPLASDDPPKSGQAYVDYLKQLGCSNAHFVIPSAATPAADMQTFAAGRGFFFSGGDQSRILGEQSRLIKGLSPTWQASLKTAWKQGAAIAGTSAGAMVWGKTAIMGGDPMETAWYGEDPNHDGIRLGAGLGLLPGFVVDTHFSQRGRLPRLAYATVKETGSLGIGVDPETAAVIRPSGSLSVTGNGTVTVVQSPPQPLPIHLPLSLKNLTVSILANGDEWANGKRTKAVTH